MMGDVIDSFKIPTTAVNQEFVRNSQIEINTCHSESYSKSWCANNVFSGYAILLPKVQEVCTVKKTR